MLIEVEMVQIDVVKVLIVAAEAEIDDEIHYFATKLKKRTYALRIFFF